MYCIDTVPCTMREQARHIWSSFLHTHTHTYRYCGLSGLCQLIDLSISILVLIERRSHKSSSSHGMYMRYASNDASTHTDGSTTKTTTTNMVWMYNTNARNSNNNNNNNNRISILAAVFCIQKMRRTRGR